MNNDQSSKRGSTEGKKEKKGFKSENIQNVTLGVWNPLFIEDKNLRDPKKHAF